MAQKIFIILVLFSIPVYFYWQKQIPKAQPITIHSQAPQFERVTLSIDSIFSENHSSTRTLPEDKKRVMLATGDVIHARSVNMQSARFNNYKWPYEKTVDVLNDADITFINLEAPLIYNCPLLSEGMVFCGSDKNLQGLLFAGIDVANLANNHAGNYGPAGVYSTIKLLNNNGILASGVNGPVYKEVRGITFAFLGYNDIGYGEKSVRWADEAVIREDIALARNKADVIIVAFHWGVEYTDQPNKRQQFLGHLAIDNGADLVIGNHPHWIQPIEIYKGRVITYAHGNFIFDQEWSLKTKQGVIGKYTFYDNKLVDIEFLPVQIENYGQPRLLEGAARVAILENMRQQSHKLELLQ